MMKNNKTGERDKCAQILIHPLLFVTVMNVTGR